MQLWFAREGKLSIREQLVTQIILGILSEDLAPGRRLPSTRELARRFRLHPNTVSAGYQQLKRDKWVEFRRGSGVYVRGDKTEAALPATLKLDQLIAGLFRSAREIHAPLSVVRSRLKHWLELQPPDHFLLIEPDEELRQIIVMEMQQAVKFPVEGCGLQELGDSLEGAVPVSLPGRSSTVQQLLPVGNELLVLQVRSVPSSLAAWLPAPSSALVGIASRWPDFLKLARTMLIAAGFHPDVLIPRDVQKPNWHRGLEQTAAVICDSLTALKLPKKLRAIPFPLLSETAIAELRRHQEFIQSPLA
jgi:DNA-binding transcriptional regulator YhcF (GntR family)